MGCWLFITPASPQQLHILDESRCVSHLTHSDPSAPAACSQQQPRALSIKQPVGRPAALPQIDDPLCCLNPFPPPKGGQESCQEPPERLKACQCVCSVLSKICCQMMLHLSTIVECVAGQHDVQTDLCSSRQHHQLLVTAPTAAAAPETLMLPPGVGPRSHTFSAVTLF